MLWEHTFLYLKKRKLEYGEHSQEEIGIKLNKFKNDFLSFFLFHFLFFLFNIFIKLLLISICKLIYQFG